MDERLQKVLARAGIAARRKAEELIVAGRVRVDGRIVTELGTKVDPRRSNVEVDGRRIMAEPLMYVLLHKPRGVMCTMSDPEGRPTVASLVTDVGVRLVSVGRLDFNTSGALLMTNDGDFAAGLCHPRCNVEKVYRAKVSGAIDDRALEGFRQSIVIDGRPTRPAMVRLLGVEGGKSWLELRLKEGRNRQIHRLGEATGYDIMRLMRVGYAGLTVEGLAPGQYRMLTLDELRELKKAFGVPKRVRPPLEEIHERAVSSPRGRPQTRVRGDERPPSRASREERPGPSGRERVRPPSRAGRDERPPSRAVREERPGPSGRERVRPPSIQGGAEARSGSKNPSGRDQSFRKKPPARTEASAPKMGRPAAPFTPSSKTRKSGTSVGRDSAQNRATGRGAVTTPRSRSRRSGSG
jgi:23S rRNA pseudouridine2605 synthase